MPENARLSGSIDQIDLAFIEREATPRFLMKLGIQLHLAGLSLSNTVSILEKRGKTTNISFSNCFSNAGKNTADDWLGAFSFAWNQRI